MFIYIDESGSFVPSSSTNSWNVVAAYVAPEATRKRYESLLRQIKLTCGRRNSDEIKLKDLPEGQLKLLLEGLSQLDSTAFASCIDLGLEDLDGISSHQRNQVEKIRANIPRMAYKEGRTLILDLANRVERLSPQLYTQMVVQIDLLDQVYRSTTLYYAQRVPATLGRFRWRIDEKNSSRPIFEETMRHMAPPLLQTKSLNEPAIFVSDFDYSHFERAFRYAEGDIPTYLQEETGVKIASASNLGKILRDFEFVRSHDTPGVQIADLLSSTFRRVLRGEFSDNLGIARRLGRLVVQRAKNQPPIHLISLSKSGHANGPIVDVANAIKAAARPMLK